MWSSSEALLIRVSSASDKHCRCSSERDLKNALIESRCRAASYATLPFSVNCTRTRFFLSRSRTRSTSPCASNRLTRAERPCGFWPVHRASSAIVAFSPADRIAKKSVAWQRVIPRSFCSRLRISSPSERAIRSRCHSLYWLTWVLSSVIAETSLLREGTARQASHSHPTASPRALGYSPRGSIVK